MSQEPRLYSHFRDVPQSAWRWPSFTPAEMACRGTGRLLVVPHAMDALQALRDRLGRPLIVRSAYRSPEHNRAVGGAAQSLHMDGIAFDIDMTNHDPAVFQDAARAVGFRGFGSYPRSGFLHIDLGPARRWGTPFAPRATPHAPDAPPARDDLAHSRTLRGTGVAGVATIGGAGIDVAQDMLRDTQDAIAPLVPWMDSLRWLFVALALAGIALAIHARLDDWRRGTR